MTTEQAENRTPPGKWTHDTDRWEAVCQRSPQADGHFVYSVSTTGVYCRPSCPSRSAKRENVGFHQSPDEAETAGFRACLRCHPRGNARQHEHAEAVTRACRAIEGSDEAPGLDDLAAVAGLSPSHFHRVFKELTGATPKRYAAAARAQRMRDCLTQYGSVTEAIYEAGFNSNGRFYAESEAMLGMMPRDYMNAGAKQRIRFAVAQCSLGAILVAASEKGICAISLGDEPDALLVEFQQRFKAAELLGADSAFEQLVAKVIAFVEGKQTSLGLPLDIRGTAFQQRVWHALQQVPSGTTISYSELAQRLGMPKGARAVASACAANTLAIAVPCHRIVRNDGGLSGYRWGVERKRTLLERESPD